MSKIEKEYEVKEAAFNLIYEKLNELSKEFYQLHQADRDPSGERYGYINDASSAFLKGICVGLNRAMNLVLTTERNFLKDNK